MELHCFLIGCKACILLQVQMIGRHGTVPSPARAQRPGSWASLKQLQQAQWRFQAQSQLLRQSLSLKSLRVCYTMLCYANHVDLPATKSLAGALITDQLMGPADDLGLLISAWSAFAEPWT